MLRRPRKRDDIEWFERILDEEKDRLYSFARYYLRDADAAADVTQEVLIRLWTHRETVDRSRPAAWLMRVCKNACLDRLRARSTRRRIEVQDDTVEYRIAGDDLLPDAVAYEEQVQHLVLKELDVMSEPYRTLVLLRDVQGMPYSEIAAATDLPLNTVKVYLHRARRRLREALPEELRNETV